MRKIFVTGIGTGVGKTLVSAILTEALRADYWKPVQSGNLENTDTMLVKSLVSNKTTRFHEEAYRLSQPLSPNIAAFKENKVIELNNINAPKTQNALVMEGAGGLFVPLHFPWMMIDLIARLEAETILVSNHYLGSINHTLLAIEALKSRKLKVWGIIFNGDENRETEETIKQYSNVPVLGRITKEPRINRDVVINYAGQFKKNLNISSYE